MKAAAEELENLLELLKIEQEEDRRLFEEQILKSSLKDRRDAGLSWYPLIIKETYYGIGDRLIMELERPSHTDIPHQFQFGKIASLFSNASSDSKDNPRISGVVSSARPNNIKLTLFVDELPDWVDDGKLGLDLLFDESSYKEMEHALLFVKKARNCRIADLREVLLGFSEPSFSESANKPPQFTTLNASQQQAVERIAQAEDVAIIHGPPGTGKTTTLVEAIKFTLENEKQVLVCAPSNTAVDLLTEKLFERGLKVLRLGNPARITEEILNHTLDVQISKHRDYKLIKELKRSSIEYKNMASKYKRSFGKEEREQRKQIQNEARKLQAEAEKIEKFIVESLVNDAQVITCTLVGANFYMLKDKIFSTVFIDEAAQALEPACWIPIIKADRVVFAGDHFQLPPTVKSIEAARKGLSTTLFEKTIERLAVDVMLEIQYRMNEKIMKFSADEFYKGKLKPHESVENRIISDQEAILATPVEFIDTAGCGYEEQSGEKSSSLENSEEAHLLLRHLDLLLKSVKQNTPDELDKIKIGIISPYKAQVNLLTELKDKNEDLKVFGKRISINTVDGFQGQERDIIYISMVRSNDRGEIGFLGDTRRMNVAMTRAKVKLVMIGDSATLSHNDFYKRLLDYIDKIEGYKSAWEFME